MGVKYSSKVWEWSASEGNDRLVLLALADWADDDGVCYPGIRRIAQKCRVSERTVQRSIRNLQSIGELRVTLSTGVKTASGCTNLYQLVIKRDDKLSPVPTQTSRGDNLGIQGVSTLSPNPSVDPSENHQTFEVFWKSYPKKKSRGQAEKAWKKIPPPLYPAILRAVEQHKKSHDWLRESGKFIPYPATWLNGKCWEDVVTIFSESKTRVADGPAVSKYEVAA